VQNRDRYELGAWNGPGSAAQRFTLHRARDTRHAWITELQKSVLERDDAAQSVIMSVQI
jgi:hypothetical protein